jgi:excisionase family DNA binding protein
MVPTTRGSSRGRIRDLNTHDEPFVTPVQIARHLGVGRKQIAKWIDAGTLPAYRFGDRQWRIRLDDARSFVERSRVRVSTPSEPTTEQQL